LEQIERAARLFRDGDDQFGGGIRYKAVIGQLNEICELVGCPCSPAMRTRLFAVMAHLSETAAIMAWDSGRQMQAQRYYILALRAARQAGDHLFGANVLAGMARQLLCTGHAGEALELIRHAQRITRAEPNDPVRALLLAREAWAYASQGRITAFRRACARAEDVLAGADRDGDPYWIEYFDTAELSGTIGGRLLELTRAGHDLAPDAAGYIEHAIGARRGQRLRSAALDQLGLVEVRVVQGELDEAARLGHQAVATVERTPSVRVKLQLAELFARTEATCDVRAVAELRDRLRPLLPIPA